MSPCILISVSQLHEKMAGPYREHFLRSNVVRSWVLDWRDLKNSEVVPSVTTEELVGADLLASSQPFASAN